MKIQMVPIVTNEVFPNEVPPEFVMIELSGPFDPDNVVFVNARNLLSTRGSKATVASFDAALKSGSLFDMATED